MYDVEEAKIIAKIKQKGYKTVLLQLPDGLKHKANTLVDTIEKETDATVVVWFGSCFGACDLPVGVKMLNIDLVVAVGHNLYVKSQEGW